VKKIFSLRLESEMEEFLRGYAKEKGYICREKPNVNRAIREIIREKMSAQETVEGKRLESAQPCESELVKKTFALLNRGEPPWKVAEEIGDIELVEKCYKKREEWMRMVQTEDLEKHRLRVESECWRLAFFISTWKDYVSPEMFIGIVGSCWSKMILPSEVIKGMFGVSLDEFISEINRKVEKIKSDPLLQLDPIIRYMVVRELLDEWHERRRERLAKMNPQLNAGEQIDVGKIIERLNAAWESMFEKYQSSIEEMIKQYL